MPTLTDAIKRLTAFNDSLDLVGGEIEQLVLEGQILSLLGAIQARIQLEGLDSKGELIGDGQYSKEESYFSLEDFRLPSLFPGASSQYRKPKKSEGVNATARMDYETFKQINGYATDIVNLTLKSPNGDPEGLWNGINLDFERIDLFTYRLKLAAVTESAKDKLNGLNAQYDIEILQPNQDELDDFIEDIENHIIEKAKAFGIDLTRV